MGHVSNWGQTGSVIASSGIFMHVVMFKILKMVVDYYVNDEETLLRLFGVSEFS